MLLSYKKCTELYGNDYQIKKQMQAGLLYRLEEGIYSTQKSESELAIISMKYPYAVFGLQSAFYYHGLTDTIPASYYLVTDKDVTKIRDKRIKQIFELPEHFSFGIEEKVYNGTQIRIYNRERMFVDLVRYKKKLSFDYYKEIINGYRKLTHELDYQMIQEYIHMLPKTNMVIEALETEVL